ncbi:hypothetical protein BT96DRAFT_958173 [Gymnopus androsaceus JB14]|uniref:Protein BCP1 n=1 Tax=Gymnopus androsaceus JB14 TaxID=1447944 RepID=A0A6A4HDT3_9AGAR|nr:hypothetical protein BT96DRAFT_958173 [Gymnopus androsaceus JB14]
MINVDFDFFNPNPSVDYQAIKHLLVQLFQRDSELFQLHSLTELILSQPSIGTTVKTDGEESDPYALLTVVNMHMHQENPSIKALSSYFLQKSASSPALQASLQQLFSQTENHVGLVLCERLINMPVQVVPHMYRMLKDELEAKSAGNTFKFSHLIILSRTYHLSMEEESYLTNIKSDSASGPSSKKKKKMKNATANAGAPSTSRPADGIYSFHPEDECVKQPRDQESFGLDTRGRLMLVPFERFGEMVQNMGTVYV